MGKPNQGDLKINSYESALAYLGTKTSRPLPGANTRLEIEYISKPTINYIRVSYQGTGIVLYYPDDSIELTAGGWLSSTTARKINSYLPYSIRLRTMMGLWIVETENNWQFFKDGITITIDELVYNGASPQEVAWSLLWHNRAKAYLKRFANALAAGGLSDTDLIDFGLLTEEQATVLIKSNNYPRDLIMLANKFYPRLSRAVMSKLLYYPNEKFESYEIPGVVSLVKRYLMKCLNLPM